jgi:hypothetical protein
MKANHPFRWILLAALTGFGFNPLLCENGAIEDARDKLRVLDGEGAQAALQEEDLDAPEVHLVRALAHYQQGELKEAITSLDQVERLIADAQAGGEKINQTRLEVLTHRLAEGRGWVAMSEKRWEDAQVEWLKVLKRTPEDEDARWNYELSWHKANPACPLREDDHEPDDTLQDAPEWVKEKAEKRLLCPGATDAYAIELPQGAIFTARVQAKLLDDQDEEATRTVKLRLYRPSTTGLDQAIKEASVELAPPQANRKTPMSGTLKVNLDQVAEAGRWVMWVEGIGRGEVEYSIVPEVDIPCPQGEDDLEPNDDVQSAKPLQDGEKPNLKICPKNDDWHIVGVPEGEVRNLEIEFDVERAPFSALVFDVKGQIVKALNSNEYDKGVMKVRLPESGVAQKFEMPAPPSSPDPTQQVSPPNTAQEDDNIPPLLAPPSATSSISPFPSTASPLQPSPSVQPQAPPSAATPNTQPNPSSTNDPTPADGSEPAEEQKGPPTPYIIRITAPEDPQNPISLGNRYKIKLSPPEEDGNKDQQDQQDQQEQEQQEQEQQEQEQQEQEQQEQEQQEQEQQEQEQQNQQQVDLQQLIDSLDEHEHNPQLEKALKLAPALPQMEDY